MDPEPIRPQGRLLAVGVALIVAAAVGAGLLVARRRSAAAASCSAVATHLTLAGDETSDVHEILRESRPDLYYRVTLAEAPVGQRLTLACEWLDPSGRTLMQNHYETRTIETARWNTHCHQRFGPDSVAGTWTVRLLAGSKTLSSDSFSVK